MGSGRMGIQPLDSAGPNVITGVLGAHRIRVRAILDPAPAFANDSRRVAGPRRYFSDDARIVLGANQTEGTRRRSLGMAKPSEGEKRHAVNLPQKPSLEETTC